MNLAKVAELLQRKSEFLDDEQQKLETILVELGDQFARALRSVLKGTFDRDRLQTLAVNMGWSDAIADFMDDALEKLIEYSKLLSEAMGFEFIITEQNELILSEYLLNVNLKLRNQFGEAIGRDMVQFAFEQKLAGNTLQNVVREASERLAVAGRSAAIEASTAATIFDRTQMSVVYENAGIELFQYWPPTLIETSRQSCINAVNDPRQETGWTREDIAKSEELDFVKGGKPYYNCRHNWIPFVDEADFN